MAWTKESASAYQKAWRQKHKDRLAALRVQNRDAILAKKRAHRLKNKDKINAYQRLWRRKNKRLSARYDRKCRLKTIYGMSQREFIALSRAQGGLCAICDAKPKRLCVDHNHQTGKIRGLICRSCNFGLGYFKDSPNRLRHAIGYLQSSTDFGSDILGKLPDLTVSPSG